MAVLDGDPSKAGGQFTIRVKFPNGYKVPPHWHPVDENVVVLRAVFKSVYFVTAMSKPS
jgi:hypothetical protein